MSVDERPTYEEASSPQWHLDLEKVEEVQGLRSVRGSSTEERGKVTCTYKYSPDFLTLEFAEVDSGTMTYSHPDKGRLQGALHVERKEDE